MASRGGRGGGAGRGRGSGPALPFDVDPELQDAVDEETAKKGDPLGLFPV